MEGDFVLIAASYLSWRVMVGRERACQPRGVYIRHDRIVEKLEIARTIGLLTDYSVRPNSAARQDKACIVVRRRAQASDKAVMDYLANLLDGLAVAAEIVVTAPSATSEMRPVESCMRPHPNGEQIECVHPSQTRARIPTAKLAGGLRARVRELWPSGTCHLQQLAAAAAMLTCLAVVLNGGHSINAPMPDSLPAGRDADAALEDSHWSPSLAAQDLARIAADGAQPAIQPQRVSDPVIPAVQPIPIAVADAAPAVAEPGPLPHRGAEVAFRPPRQEQGSGDAGTQRRPDQADLMKKEVIVGVWAPDAGTCSARDFREGMLPTVINAEGAWAGETFCIFTKQRQTETGWRVVAKCSSPRERWTSDVRLSVKDNRLTWSSKRGSQVYTRCAPDILMAHAR